MLHAPGHFSRPIVERPLTSAQPVHPMIEGRDVSKDFREIDVLGRRSAAHIITGNSAIDHYVWPDTPA